MRSVGAKPGRPAFEVKEGGGHVKHPAPENYNARLFWKPEGPEGQEQEVLSFRGATNPFTSYGVGVLHPTGVAEIAAEAEAEAKTDSDEDEVIDTADGTLVVDAADSAEAQVSDSLEEAPAADTDLEISNPDANKPSTMAVTFRVRMDSESALTIRLPRAKRHFWQDDAQEPFALNGRYERFTLSVPVQGRAQPLSISSWRRLPAVATDAMVTFAEAEFSSLPQPKPVPLAASAPAGFRLDVQVYPRKLPDGSWLVTAVLRNASTGGDRQLALFQSYFEVVVSGGEFLPYPESQRPFDELDDDEQSMQLLYMNSHCWAIGHGCAAGWDADEGKAPQVVFADVFPAVELPSMTADIKLGDSELSIGMESLAQLPEDPTSGGAWESLQKLVDGYEQWIELKRKEVATLPSRLTAIANRQLGACEGCWTRMSRGLELLKGDPNVRSAFKWANEAMLLQQIAAKQLPHRPLAWNEVRAVPNGTYVSPADVRRNNRVREGLGNWRAFQIAFLLTSIEGVIDPESADREIVDLVWFPTGGGKTEAYLGVAAFHLLHERLKISSNDSLRRDGTTVMMRYTLRMLTTDQFQRAASLICALEWIRRANQARIQGDPFRLGLWLGGEGSPNTIETAKKEISRFAAGKARGGNPLVLTECPWCRAEIGRLPDELKPRKLSDAVWARSCLGGIKQSDASMHCPDLSCAFGGENRLPVEVVDERIYDTRPSLLIGTADKFAMLAYKPEAGSLFGRAQRGQVRELVFRPPSLVIQDELHLISGPLGTLFGLYETAISALCTIEGVGPKIIASTATIRGASAQVRALFARDSTALFPPPGLEISDSFFGRYARDEAGKLRSGRTYVGIQALYGSLQTTQQRTFSAVLARATTFDDEQKDPWWTLLAFYNSIRELSGAQTLFDSDIQSRLKHLADREGIGPRYLFKKELTSRLSQADIVDLKDKLSKSIKTGSEPDRVDACLASNIIEVGVDIERLSLMAVVGQPKSTASYIQVTGRVGRRWWERPGLILTLYNPHKSRDRSHFEQFHTYHPRLYERVEPTSATPFSIAALQRGLVGASIAWLRQQIAVNTPNDYESFAELLNDAEALFAARCNSLELSEGDLHRSMAEIQRLSKRLRAGWKNARPQEWFEWVLDKESSVLMLIPGAFATGAQKISSFTVPTSLRQVDGQAELEIEAYDEDGHE
jgi:hypothetical protein